MANRAVVADRPDTAVNRIVFAGHATVLIECEGVRLLTDPVLRPRVLHLRRHVRPVADALTADLDAVLISHMHHDHLDLASLRRLGHEVPMLVPAGAGSWLRRRRFRAVQELRVGESSGVGALKVSAVEARHHGRRPGGPPSESLGFLVRGRRAIYFAGDTELFPEIAELPAPIDVALLPVSGWGPRLGPGHMDPLDAARATSLLKPSIAIPIHWGTLRSVGLRRRHRARLADAPHRFAEHVDRLAPEVEVRVLEPGEETTF
jgi:L-ascorbate metabolism protein UlaG (beta-lactamase superfamily)